MNKGIFYINVCLTIINKMQPYFVILSSLGEYYKIKEYLGASFIDRMELLEIAKANAAKALGTTNFELPPSLRIVPVSKETNHGTSVSNNGAKFEVSILGLSRRNLQKAAARPD